MVLVVLAVTVVVFAIDRWRVDLVAVMSLLALVAVGAVDTGEALAGFSAEIVIMIGALFIVGEGLTNTGIATRVAAFVAGIGRRRPGLLLPVLMVLSAFLSAVMSSTGTVAVMLPVVMGLARQLGRSPAGLLLPMAFAAQLGGLLTLIGTPPNLVVSKALEEATGQGLGFLQLSPYGLVGLLAAVVLMVAAGRWLLPGASESDLNADAPPTMRELGSRFGVEDKLWVLDVEASSPYAGSTAASIGARRQYGVAFFAVARPPETAWGRPWASAVEPDTRFEAGDRLLVTGRPEAIDAFAAGGGLEARRYDPADADDRTIVDFGLVEALLTPGSRLIGRTVREAGIGRRFGVDVAAVRRRGKVLDQPVSTTTLDFGDSLLLVGTWDQLERLRGQRFDLIVADAASPGADRLPGAVRAPWALLVVVAMLGLMMFSNVDLVWPVVGAALAMVLGGAVEVRSIYRVVHWPSLVMVAAMLPSATALKSSGALDLLMGGLTTALADAPLAVSLAAVMLATSLLSQVISNTATSVLIAPVAVQLASQLGIDPTPLLIGVAVAASTAFTTPVASPVNALVMGPGGYRFADFLRAGSALQLLVLVLGGLMILLLSF
jgi:di/tricarboxylate transporter